ncbi:MAG TPA: Maf family protein, partial [Smithellaceae bacterium]|nr:Maf family protein [Smithellaceae bacterium]HOD63409.1 Maf family protein [Smithellaceae bacterium]HOH57447.1 Maf family protein [Smithellaceae bacterium]HQK90464.1 Maf family protein [Smithellaceae bacterium]
RERFETVPYIQPSTSRHPLFHCLKKCNGNFELTGHDYSGIKKPDFEKKESIMVLSLSSPLILASASPRRKELLSAVGLTFKVRPADVDETGLPDENPRAHVRRLSAEKAAVIARRYPKALVLGADTIVVIDGQILGKPRDQKQARAMMRQLSNRKHTVFTGFTIACKQTGAAKTGVVQSAVYFKEISPDEMDWYVNSREPYDKAGGYAAQGMGASFIQAIRGSYTNVIGLPLCEVMEALKSMDAIHFREPA